MAGGGVMTKFKPFDPKTSSQKIVYFRVVDYCGDPTLVACNDKGEVDSYIATITENGELALINDVDDDLGLSLNADGQIKVRLSK